MRLTCPSHSMIRATGRRVDLATASAICTRCGQQNPDGFRFRGSRAAPLETAPAIDQRKVVTVAHPKLEAFTGSIPLGEGKTLELGQRTETQGSARLKSGERQGEQ
jgi:hypothetical protein